jgi:hypothetical protein
MPAFIPGLFPLVPILLGAGAVAVCRTEDKQKVQIEALERKA